MFGFALICEILNVIKGIKMINLDIFTIWKGVENCLTILATFSLLKKIVCLFVELLNFYVEFYFPSHKRCFKLLLI